MRVNGIKYTQIIMWSLIKYIGGFVILSLLLSYVFHVTLSCPRVLDAVENVNNIIYKLSEWLLEKLEELRPKETVETSAGEAKILKLFSQTKDKQVVGGQVMVGELKRGREVKILRRGTEIGRGRLTDLEQAKQKATTVTEGQQFGAVVESKWTIASGDVIQTFDLVSQ